MVCRTRSMNFGHYLWPETLAGRRRSPKATRGSHAHDSQPGQAENHARRFRDAEAVLRVRSSIAKYSGVLMPNSPTSDEA